MTSVPVANSFLAQELQVEIGTVHQICNCIVRVGECIQFMDLGFSGATREWWRSLRNSVVHDQWKPGFDTRLDDLIRDHLVTPGVWSNLATHATDLLSEIIQKLESLTK